MASKTKTHGLPALTAVTASGLTAVSESNDKDTPVEPRSTQWSAAYEREHVASRRLAMSPRQTSQIPGFFESLTAFCVASAIQQDRFSSECREHEQAKSIFNLLFAAGKAGYRVNFDTLKKMVMADASTKKAGGDKTAVAMAELSIGFLRDVYYYLMNSLDRSTCLPGSLRVEQRFYSEYDALFDALVYPREILMGDRLPSAAGGTKAPAKLIAVRNTQPLAFHVYNKTLQAGEPPIPPNQLSDITLSGGASPEDKKTEEWAMSLVSFAVLPAPNDDSVAAFVQAERATLAECQVKAWSEQDGMDVHTKPSDAKGTESTKDMKNETEALKVVRAYLAIDSPSRVALEARRALHATAHRATFAELRKRGKKSG